MAPSTMFDDPLGNRLLWGSTNYADAIDYVTDLHADNPGPALVIFQTDG